MFSLIDVDGSGSLDLNEVALLLKYITKKHLRINITSEEVEAMVFFFDDDDSSDLSFGELVNIIRVVVSAKNSGALRHLALPREDSAESLRRAGSQASLEVRSVEITGQVYTFQDDHSDDQFKPSPQPEKEIVLGSLFQRPGSQNDSFSSQSSGRAGSGTGSATGCGSLTGSFQGSRAKESASSSMDSPSVTPPAITSPSSLAASSLAASVASLAKPPSGKLVEIDEARSFRDGKVEMLDFGSSQPLSEPRSPSSAKPPQIGLERRKSLKERGAPAPCPAHAPPPSGSNGGGGHAGGSGNNGGDDDGSGGGAPESEPPASPPAPLSASLRPGPSRERLEAAEAKVAMLRAMLAEAREIKAKRLVGLRRERLDEEMQRSQQSQQHDHSSFDIGGDWIEAAWSRLEQLDVLGVLGSFYTHDDGAPGGAPASFSGSPPATTAATTAATAGGAAKKNSQFFGKRRAARVAPLDHEDDLDGSSIDTIVLPSGSSGSSGGQKQAPLKSPVGILLHGGKSRSGSSSSSSSSFGEARTVAFASTANTPSKSRVGGFPLKKKSPAKTTSTL